MQPTWQSDDGTVQLYLGDCLDVLPTLDQVDAVVTDLPYGLNQPYEVYQDTQVNLRHLIQHGLPEMRKIANRVVFTCGITNVHLFPEPDWILCWAYSGGGSRGKWGFNVWQPLLAYGPDPYLQAGLGARPDLIYRTETSEDNGHPCPKPLGVWTKVVERCSLERHTVLDPFMGSGTTGVACVRTGRRFVGIEIDPTYFAIAVKRIQDALAQPRLLPVEPEPSYATAELDLPPG